MKKRAIVVLLILLAVAGVTVTVWGAGETPGSEGDPLVTKSYVDQKLAETENVFTPLEIKAGGKLTGAEGAEIILRSGEAVAIGSEDNGVADLTSGQDLMSGAAVGQNHLLLIPRNDGRGVEAVTDVWILIRGAYSLQEAETGE
ncbi:MAG: hypothetical protein LBT26_02605 [Clostridiales Family XIII bacterium]|jgi:hypothetical protein|nr:hypothetical protein [Clostridiales Family XIII bacterium]